MNKLQSVWTEGNDTEASVRLSVYQAAQYNKEDAACIYEIYLEDRLESLEGYRYAIIV